MPLQSPFFLRFLARHRQNTLHALTKYHLYFDESSAITYAVSASEIRAASAAETRARRQQTRRLNFASPAPSPLAPKRKLKTKSRLWDGVCTIGILGAIGYALAIAAVFSTGLFSCRTVSPEWVCGNLGYPNGGRPNIRSPLPSEPEIEVQVGISPSAYGALSNPNSPKPWYPGNEPSTPTPDTSPPATPKPSRPPPHELKHQAVVS